MNRFGLKKILALTLLLAFIISVPLFAQKKEPSPDYFPLAVGYWWTYKMVEGGGEFTLKVTGVEKIGDVQCYKVETVASNGNVMIIEYYAKLPGKVLVYRQEYPTSKMNADYNPVRLFLHNPLKVGDSWEWKGKGMMDMEIEETKNVEKMEIVEVPAGKFSCALVPSIEKRAGTETKKNYWYANHIGMVKSTTDTGTGVKTAVLVKYNLKAK